MIAILIFDDSEMRRLDSIRRDFVANISHELKTPIGALSILSEAVLDPTWKHGIETAIDMTLLGRYYERCADHAVSIARRVYFLVTGSYANGKS